MDPATLTEKAVDLANQAKALANQAADLAAQAAQLGGPATQHGAERCAPSQIHVEAARRVHSSSLRYLDDSRQDKVRDSHTRFKVL